MAIPGKEPVDAELTLQVNGENERQILEGLENSIATNLSVEHDADGTVTASLEIAATGMTMTPSDSTPDPADDAEPPVYDSPVNWDTGRVNTDEWDVNEETAKQVYDNLIEKVSKAVKVGEPSAVVVGEPQYRALWVYVDQIHTTAENPESLVPLRMMVVPGPMLHVETRNLDVLFGSD